MKQCKTLRFIRDYFRIFFFKVISFVTAFRLKLFNLKKRVGGEERGGGQDAFIIVLMRIQIRNVTFLQRLFINIVPSFCPSCLARTRRMTGNFSFSCGGFNVNVSVSVNFIFQTARRTCHLKKCDFLWRPPLSFGCGFSHKSIGNAF